MRAVWAAALLNEKPPHPVDTALSEREIQGKRIIGKERGNNQ
jgi:hypothetical protein